MAELAVLHEFDYRNWWTGEVVMLCGATFAPGNNERVLFRFGERFCHACERVEKGG